MNESILDTIKKLLGLSVEYDEFDQDIIVCINTALSILNQIGVKSFSITGEDETWEDYIGTGTSLDMIKNYIHLKVRMLFDPPMSSAVTEVYNHQLTELESRISFQVDPADSEE